MVKLRNIDSSSSYSLSRGEIVYDTINSQIVYSTSGSDKKVLMTTNLTGPIGINTSGQNAQLEVNATSGPQLRLTFNDDDGNALHYTDQTVDSNGNLTINASGGSILMSSDDSVDILGHNGTTRGLKLAGSLVLSSAVELNRLNGLTPGTAMAGKAVVLDDAANIEGLQGVSLQTLTIDGTDVLATADELNYVQGLTPGTASFLHALVTDDNGSIAGINNIGVTSININGTTLTTSAVELNYLTGVTPGTAVASKAVVMDAGNDIAGIDSLTATSVTATSVTGTLQTAAQPNVTSVGTLTSLSTGNITLNGTAITSTAPEINYLSGVVPGTATASKAVVMDAGNDIAGIDSLTASTITGTLQTAAQANVTSVGTLTGLSVSGVANITNTTNASGPTSGGSFTTAGGMGVAKSLYVGNDLTVNGNLVVSGETTTINSSEVLIADNTITLNSGPSGSGHDSGILTQRYQTENALGTGDIVSDTPEESRMLSAVSSTSITFGNDADSNDDFYNNWWIKVIDGSAQNQVRQIVSYVGSTRTATLSSAFDTTPSVEDSVSLYPNEYSTLIWQSANRRFITAYASKDFKNSTLNVIDYADFGVNKMEVIASDNSVSPSTGAILSAGGLGISNATNASSSSNGGSFTTAGGAAVGKSLYVGMDVNVSGKTLTQSLNIAGTDLSSTASELNYLSGVVPGMTAANKAVVMDSSNDIAGIDSLTASTITGTLQTAAQPNVTSVGTLTSLSTGDITLNGTAITSTAPEINYLSGVVPGTTAANKAVVMDSSNDIAGIDSLTASTITGTLQTAAQPNVTSVGTLTSLSTGDITLNGTAITSTAPELNYLSGVVPGTTAASKAVVMDSSNDIAGIDSLTASTITGTLQTTAQPNVTSVGTLTSLSTGDITLNGTAITSTASEINYLSGITPGTATAGKAVVMDSGNDISGIDSLSVSTITINGTVFDPASSNAVINGSTPGVVTASKAVIVDANKDIVGFNSLSSSAINIDASALSTITNKGLVITNASKTAATSYTDGGTLTIDGGATITKNLYVWNGITSAGGINSNGAVQGFGLRAKSVYGNDLIITDMDNARTGLTGMGISLGTQNSLGFFTNNPSNESSGPVFMIDGATNYVSVSTGIGGRYNNPLPVINGSTSNNIYNSWVGSKGIRLYGGTIQTYGVGNPWTTNMVPYANPTTCLQNNLDNSGQTYTFGYIKPEFTETYTFTFNSVGTFYKVFIDGIYVGCNNSDVGTLAQTYTKSMTANVVYAVSVYVLPQVVSSGSFSFKWQSTSRTLQDVPIVNAGDARQFIKSEAVACANDLTVYNMNASSTSPVFGKMSSATNGNLNIMASGSDIQTNSLNSFDVVGHDGSTKGLKLAGELLTASAVELNYNDGSIPGTAVASKTLVTDSSNGISGLANLSVDTLSIGGTAFNPSTSLPVINGVVAGTVSADKAVVVDSSKDISSFNNLTAVSFYGTMQTAAQPNVTSVGTLTSLNVSGNVVSSSTDASLSASTGAVQLVGGVGINNSTDAMSSTNGGSITTAGGVAIAKSLYVGSTINAGSDVIVSGNLTVNGTTTTINSETLMIDDNMIVVNSAPAGTSDAGILAKRFQLDVSDGSGDVVSDDPAETYALDTATSTTITLPSSANTNANYYKNWWVKITSGAAAGQVRKILSYAGFVATLDSAFSVSPTEADNVSLYDTSYTALIWQESTKRYIAAYTTSDPGTDAVNVSAYADFGAGNIIVESNVPSTSSLTGSITAVGGLGIADATDAVSASNGGSITTAGGVAIGKSLYVGTNFSAGSGSSTITLNGSVLTSTAPELNYLHSVVPGTSTASKALVMDSSNDIAGIDSLTASSIIATSITGTLQTVAQPNITSVGTLTSLSTGDITLNGSVLTSTAPELNYLSGVVPGTSIASKALVMDASNDIAGIDSLTASSLTATSVTGTLQTSAQPNVTSVGDLNGLTVKNSSAINNAISYPLTVKCDTTTTPDAGLGVGISYKIENSANTDKIFGSTTIDAQSVADGAENANYHINLLKNGSMTEAMRVSYTGDVFVYGGGQFQEVSDRRMKENIELANHEDSFKKIMDIEIKNYNFIGKDKTHRGFIAQELKHIIPEAINIQANERFDDFHTICYKEMIGYMIQTMQHMNKNMSEMKDEMDSLRQKVEMREQEDTSSIHSVESDIDDQISMIAEDQMQPVDATLTHKLIELMSSINKNLEKLEKKMDNNQ